MTTWVDPPSGWQYGFPRPVPDEVLADPDKFNAWILATGYPPEDWKWAQNHVRMWRE